MPFEEVRYMWLIVFFDLPVKTKKERRAANTFRNFLKKDGYDMLQLSVYARICRGREAVDTRLRRLDANLPPAGFIRAMQVTDKQYARMHVLLGESTTQESIATEQLLLF